jgi:hypothetical protein
MATRLRSWIEQNRPRLERLAFTVNCASRDNQYAVDGEHKRGFFEITDWDGGWYDYSIVSSSKEFDDVLVRGERDEKFDQTLDGILNEILSLFQIDES